jgi:hypothetical protein
MKQLLLVALLCHALQFVFCQAAADGNTLHEQPGTGRFINHVNSQAAALEDKITRQTEKYLAKLAKQEARLKKKLQKIDPAAAQHIFNLDEKYKSFSERLKQKTEAAATGNYYIPLLDTLKTAFNFLEQNKNLLSLAATLPGLKNALSALNTLQGKVNGAEEIRKFLKGRREFLQQQLSNFGLTRELKKFSQTVHYYQAQIEEYKQLLNEPDKLIVKSLGLLQKVPAFAGFFRKHSELASIFRLPGNGPIDPASLTGLQTRAGVMNQLQQRFGSAGANPQQMLQQQIAGAQEQLSKLKDKLNGPGGNSSDIEMPGYKINNQKTKSFLKRLEFGANLQSKRPNGIFPTTTDIGLSAGFKATDKISIGIGAATAIGWGKDIRHISMSWQGLSLRSYIEMKAKGNLFITAGAEMHYRSEIRQFAQLKDYPGWQKSALAGITKKYVISKKLKGNAQLLYDFLAERQKPVARPLVLRVGYNLN